MVPIRRLSGTWRGRLVDVQGFEGDLTLTLKSDSDGTLKGSFDVDISTHHESLRYHGDVQGRASEQRVDLTFAIEKPVVKVVLTGVVLDLRDGGAGLRATYEVSARTFSPLQGGIACASKDHKAEVDIATKREWQAVGAAGQ